MTAPISVHRGVSSGQAARHAPVSAAAAAKPPRDLALAFASMKHFATTDVKENNHTRVPVGDKPSRSMTRQRVAVPGGQTGRASTAQRQASYATSRQTTARDTREGTGAPWQSLRRTSDKCDPAAAPKSGTVHGSDLNCSSSSSHSSRSSKDEDNDEFESELKLERQRERQLGAVATNAASQLLAPEKLKHRLRSSGRSSGNAHEWSERLAQPLPLHAPSAVAEAKDANNGGVPANARIDDNKTADVGCEVKSSIRRQGAVRDNRAYESAKYLDEGDSNNSTNHHDSGIFMPRSEDRDVAVDRPWVDAPAIGGLGLELTLDVTATPHSNERGNDHFADGADDPEQSGSEHEKTRSNGLEIPGSVHGGGGGRNHRNNRNNRNIGKACLGSAQYDLSASGTLTVDAFQIRRGGTQRCVQPPPPLPPAQPSQPQHPSVADQSSSCAPATLTAIGAKGESRAIPSPEAGLITESTEVAKLSPSSSAAAVYLTPSSRAALLPDTTSSLGGMVSGALCDELVGLGMLGAGASSTVSKVEKP